MDFNDIRLTGETYSVEVNPDVEHELSRSWILKIHSISGEFLKVRIIGLGFAYLLVYNFDFYVGFSLGFFSVDVGGVVVVGDGYKFGLVVDGCCTYHLLQYTIISYPIISYYSYSSPLFISCVFVFRFTSLCAFSL
ncbi:hypothetical protein L1887_03092 [Cichorium endivia]|nr:hypothetical protein L1887_03092 [Cichorium endivia]